MPNIVLRVPKGSLSIDARKALLREVTEAAAGAERIPANPQNRATTWVVLEEIDEGMWAVGGVDMSAHLLPCMAVVYVPQGVLDESLRALYVRLLHQAFVHVLHVNEKRRLATSVILQEVSDGYWGGSGTIWTLVDLARAAGYEHLQHLVPSV